MRISKSSNMKSFISPKLFLILAVFFFSCNQSKQNDSVTEKTDSGELDRTILPIPEPPFGGKIGETYKDSKEEWPKLVTPPQGAPNVIIILLDDVGFGQVSTFGGPVPTPELDKLAANGLKYNRFHTTAICGPSRAALLTGRNHHNAGSGFLAEWATGYPSYNCMIPKTTATSGRILKGNGYSTSWFGKNHNTPDWETSVTGPFDRWPTGLGFDYFYGFNAGETHQYYPVLFENTKAVEPDKSPEQGYHFMTDMTDRAINWLEYSKSVAPQKPVMLYFAPGAAHAPHHAPKEWRDKFKGQFDKGWDVVRQETYERQLKMGIIPKGTKLTPRPDWVTPWDKLSADQKKLFARLMENYAGYLSFADHETGRLLEAISKLPDADNTLIFYIVGDNGASSEGGMEGTVNEIKALSGIATPLADNLKHLDEIGNPNTEPHYPVGWAWAGNAPFQWVKQVASHFGGSRNPMVVSWPKVIKDKGGMRSQFVHLIDVLPTVLDASHLPAPKTVDGVEQKPMDGVSFLSTFTDKNAKPVRTRQYFEIFSNRAIYDNGWVAATQHTFPWRQDFAPGNWDKDKWELYNIEEDYSESVDLAKKYPEKLEELKTIFNEEAKKYNVYPLDDRGTGRLISPKPTPSDPKRKHFTFYAGATRLAETASPNTKNKSHSITAEIELKSKSDSGIIVASGGSSAGFALYVQNGKLVYHYNYFDDARYVITSKEALPVGKSTVRFDFAYDGGGTGKGGTGKLYINNKLVGEGRIDKTVAARFGIDTFGIGEDTGSPVAYSYKLPFKFTGKIDKVNIDLK
ncbi:arylsulfatase [Flavobacterium cutihirudinis]|uniref:Arylsulfatase n=2 Tax=Flavobacterium cutihirudinis TaxID=1265740 RepID=A0A3D9FS26_9FLAO|nr:arylsulfatase [Flavobacterium cutihirudinis]